MCKQEENVVLISLEKLQPFPGHPFQVRDDQLMQQLVDSIPGQAQIDFCTFFNFCHLLRERLILPLSKICLQIHGAL